MDRTIINATLRSEKGKSAARHMRAQGLVPAVVYGHEQEAMPLSLQEREIRAALSGGVYTTHIFDLLISGEGAPKKPIAVMIKEVQRNPISRVLQNIDLHAISLKEKVNAHVPIRLHGEPAGLRKGGILERQHLEITVSCLPTQIPDHLDVDISVLEINDSVHVRDLPLPSDVELLTPGEEIVVLLAPPAKVVEEVPVVAEVEEEGKEPELVGQKGEKTEEEAEK